MFVHSITMFTIKNNMKNMWLFYFCQKHVHLISFIPTRNKIKTMRTNKNLYPSDKQWTTDLSTYKLYRITITFNNHHKISKLHQIMLI